MPFLHCVLAPAESGPLSPDTQDGFMLTQERLKELVKCPC